MPGRLGDFEFVILATLIRYPEGTYGARLHTLLEEHGRPSSIGALYTTLDRMERKGFVKSRWGEPTAERGGRRKRFFEVTGVGMRALADTQAERAKFQVAGPIDAEFPS